MRAAGQLAVIDMRQRRLSRYSRHTAPVHDRPTADCIHMVFAAHLQAEGRRASSVRIER